MKIVFAADNLVLEQGMVWERVLEIDLSDQISPDNPDQYQPIDLSFSVQNIPAPFKQQQQQQSEPPTETDEPQPRREPPPPPEIHLLLSTAKQPGKIHYDLQQNDPRIRTPVPKQIPPNSSTDIRLNTRGIASLRVFARRSPGVRNALVSTQLIQ